MELKGKYLHFFQPGKRESVFFWFSFCVFTPTVLDVGICKCYCVFLFNMAATSEQSPSRSCSLAA